MKDEEGHLAKNKAVDKIKAFYYEICKTVAKKFLDLWFVEAHNDVGNTMVVITQQKQTS